MKKRVGKRDRRDGLRREHDLAKLKRGVRGKYVARYKQGTNLILLSPDVAQYFPDEQAVNAAWRALIHAAKRPVRRAHATPSKDSASGEQLYSNCSTTISGFDPSRSGGPQVPAPLEVKTCIFPIRLKPYTNCR